MPNPNTVCHLTSVHPHTDTRILIKECTSLAAYGYRIHLVATGAPTFQHNGVQIHGIAGHSKGRFSRIALSTRKTYRVAVDIGAALYHFHDPELIPYGVRLGFGKSKVIYDVHENMPMQVLTKHHIPLLLRKPTSYLIELIEDSAVRKFDAVVTSTPEIQERFASKGVLTESICNYPLTNEFGTEPVAWGKREKALCYIGSITEDRGLNEMIEAVNCTQLKLYLAGKFHFKKEENRIKHLLLNGKIKYLGFLDRKNIQILLSSVQAGLVLLHPLKNYLDALPVKMFEYMAAGIPVIASNFPKWREIIEKNYCGICVEPKSPQQIAEAMQWIADHPNEADEMGKNGRKIIKQKYNWESEKGKLIKLYERLLG